MRFRPATMGRKEPFRTLHNGHSPRACCLQTPSNGLVSEICLCLSLRHDYPFKLGFRGTRDRGCWRCEGVPGELTLVFATPGPVTTLLRDTQVHEFGTVFRFPVDADRRSDTFTSQTVTTLFCSTPVVVGRFRDAVLATQLCRLQASLGFLQDADDLFFGESLFHCRSSLERTLHRHRTKRGEQVNFARSPLALLKGAGDSRSNYFACLAILFKIASKVGEVGFKYVSNR